MSELYPQVRFGVNTPGYEIPLASSRYLRVHSPAMARTVDFKTFFMGLSIAEREQFAEQAGSTVGSLNHVASGRNPVELGMADVLVTLGRGAFDWDGLALTDKATKQRVIRGDFQIERARLPNWPPSGGRKKG